MTDPRLSRIERGKQAEALVETYLEARGFSLVARNLRLGALELDLVARQGPLVVVVEVRSRAEASWTTALGSLDAKKRQRIRRAGERLWNRRYRNDLSVSRLRFDAAAVYFEPSGPRVEYVPAAF